MDISFTFLVLIGVILSIIAVRNGKNADLFTFPFLFPAVTVTFVLVEFGDFMLNAGGLYDIYRESGVISVALFMIASCAVFGLVGHAMGARGAAKLRVAPVDLVKPDENDVRYMHFASVTLGLLSFAAFAALANLGGGFQEYIFYSGAYSIEWTGLPVYLVFVVRLVYVSIVIQLWLWVRTKRSRHLRWALFFALIPLINILFIFRRSEVIKLGIFFGYFLTNYRYVSIGRIPAFLSLFGMYMIFKIFPLLRDEAGKQMEIGELVDVALTNDAYERGEISSGLIRIYQSMETGVFEYGALLYNQLIRQFVPAGLVGTDLKSSLMMASIENADTSFTEFRYYLSPMGFAQAYQQFWVLGGLFFFAIGLLMARLERDRFFSYRKEILLVLMIPTAVMSVSASLSLFVPQLIIYAVIVFVSVPKSVRKDYRAPASHSLARV